MTPILESAASAWWGWVAPMSVQVAVLIGVIAAVDRALAGWSSPRLRTALWALVPLKLVLPPWIASPWSIVRWLPMTGEGSLTAPEAPAPAWQVAAFLAWLAGTLLVAVLAVERHRRAGRAWLRLSAEPPDREIEAAIRRAARRLHLRSVPEIRVVRGAPGPAVVGVLRPVVVLPAELLRRSTAAQREHVLLHELAHVRRRDPIAAFGMQALQVLYWFHPGAAIARRSLATLREIGCDGLAVRALGRRAPEYRRTLLELARPLLSAPVPGIAFVHRHGQLVSRLEWLARPLAPDSWKRRSASWALLGLLLVCCVPLAPSAARPPLPLAPDGVTSIADLEGCLQKRFVVLAMLAREDAAAAER